MRHRHDPGTASSAVYVYHVPSHELSALLRPPGAWHEDHVGTELTSQGYNLVEAAGTSAIAPCRVGGDLTGIVLGTDPMLGPLTQQRGHSDLHGGPPAADQSPAVR